MANSEVWSFGGKKVWVAGHNGMVGSALVRKLRDEDCEIVLAERANLDLRSQDQTLAFLSSARPAAVFLAAARVGGILANSSHPVPFLYDNLMIEANVLHASHLFGVEKLLFLGSSCIYPKLAPQPIREDALLTGPLEKTNEWYAIAKIAGLKLCQAYREEHGSRFIAAMPTNLYGPNDNFDPEASHVVPALMRKIHTAKLEGCEEIGIWGTGTPLREFMHVDDLADACVHLMKNYDSADPVNVGTGEELSIRELAELLCSVIGTEARLVFDPSKPDGTPRKLLDLTRLAGTGWRHRIPLREGLEQTYEWYAANVAGRKPARQSS